MDNPEKLATQGTRDTGKINKGNNKITELRTIL